MDWSIEKIDWPRPELLPRSPLRTSMATAGSSRAGKLDDSNDPRSAAVGANSPVMASWRVRRSASSVTPGGSNLVVPSDSMVPSSTGAHCTAALRCWPSGKVTVNWGA